MAGSATSPSSNSHVVPSTSGPSYFNREALVGLATGILVRHFLLPVPFLSLAGLVIGAIAGKNKQLDEERNGKVVFRNNKTEILKSALIGAAIGVMLVAAPIIVSHVAAGTSVFAVLSGANATAAAAVGAFTALSGALLGKRRVDREWNAAEDYVARHGEYNGKGQTIAKAQEPAQTAYANSISPQEAALLEARQQNPKSFGEQVSQGIDTSVRR